MDLKSSIFKDTHSKPALQSTLLLHLSSKGRLRGRGGFGRHVFTVAARQNTLTSRRYLSKSSFVPEHPTINSPYPLYQSQLYSTNTHTRDHHNLLSSKIRYGIGDPGSRSRIRRQYKRETFLHTPHITCWPQAASILFLNNHLSLTLNVQPSQM